VDPVDPDPDSDPDPDPDPQHWLWYGGTIVVNDLMTSSQPLRKFMG
jgi:hypothetical protein